MVHCSTNILSGLPNYKKEWKCDRLTKLWTYQWIGLVVKLVKKGNVLAYQLVTLAVYTSIQHTVVFYGILKTFYIPIIILAQFPFLSVNCCRQKWNPIWSPTETETLPNLLFNYGLKFNCRIPSVFGNTRNWISCLICVPDSSVYSSIKLFYGICQPTKL